MLALQKKVTVYYDFMPQWSTSRMPQVLSLVLSDKATHPLGPFLGRTNGRDAGLHTCGFKQNTEKMEV
jgi:hypothetical protein